MSDPPVKGNGGSLGRPAENARHYDARRVAQDATRALLRLILAKLSEIEAQLKSPLAVRQLHLRYCCKCGERVTNANVGGYEGHSALTGRLFCDLCADEAEAPP